MPEFDDIDIYPVTGRALFGTRTDEMIIAQLAAGGAKIVQLREKSMSDRSLLELARLYRSVTDKHGMILIVNDRPDIAFVSGADGVHLGRDDLPVAEARRILGPNAIIGASSHTVEQAVEAQGQGASYVNIGPLFKTPTKPDANAIGLGPVREVLEAVSIPVTVMGGVLEGNLGDVLSTGVRHIGMITALFGEADVASATRKMVTAINNGRLRNSGARDTL